MDEEDVLIYTLDTMNLISRDEQTCSLPRSMPTVKQPQWIRIHPGTFLARALEPPLTEMSQELHVMGFEDEDPDLPVMPMMLAFTCKQGTAGLHSWNRLRNETLQACVLNPHMTAFYRMCKANELIKRRRVEVKPHFLTDWFHNCYLNLQHAFPINCCQIFMSTEPPLNRKLASFVEGARSLFEVRKGNSDFESYLIINQFHHFGYPMRTGDTIYQRLCPDFACASLMMILVLRGTLTITILEYGTLTVKEGDTLILPTGLYTTNAAQQVSTLTLLAA